MRSFACRLAIIAAIALAMAGAALAQSDRSAMIAEARAAIVDIRGELESARDSDLDALEAQLRELRDNSRKRLADVESEISELNLRINALGSAPQEGDPPESEAVAAERAQLNERLAALNGQRTRINANIIEANDLLATASASRIQRFYSKLTTRGPSPLAPSTWTNAAPDAADAARKVSRHFNEWHEGKKTSGEARGALLFSIGALIVAIIIFWPVNRWIVQTFAATFSGENPPMQRRVMVAGLKMLARAVPGVIGGFLIIETWRAQGLITSEGESVAHIFWLIILDFLIVTGFLRGLFAPENPAWRLAPIDAARGRTVSALIISIVAIFAIKTLSLEIATITGVGANLTALINAAGAIAIAVILYILSRRRIWRSDDGERGVAKSIDDDTGDDAEGPAQKVPEQPEQKSSGWRYLRRASRAIAIIMGLAALIGYTALADFLASRIYFLAAILALAWFARALLREAVFWLRGRFQDDAPDYSKPSRDGGDNFEFWTVWLINLLLAFILAPIALILIGFPISAVIDLGGQFLTGFRIGTVQIPSIINVVFAIATFLAVVIVTRIIQKTFRAGPLRHSNMDPGAQDSLVTLIGYAGLIAAAFAAISAIGFDLRNLAIIAGALSVGIGFGLQSIVNNFVSGLILLFERPIKAGDWIVTASSEGIVKKISVRSTEIETWDRSSLIIPNSELISSPLLNWTHKNKLGRVIVPVGVAYDSDPEQVKEILLKCAKDHPKTVSYPEPFVTWQDFGASSLDFDVRAYLADISDGIRVRTDLRFAIFKALKEAGVEIPFPQRDVHVKSVPPDFRLREADDA